MQPEGGSGAERELALRCEKMKGLAPWDASPLEVAQLKGGGLAAAAGEEKAVDVVIHAGVARWDELGMRRGSAISRIAESTEWE